MHFANKSSSSSIPTSSMADLAFLLLIFFFVATVIDVDSGLGLNLPEYTDQHPKPIAKNRFAGILINANNEISLNNEIILLSGVKDELKKRISEKNDLPKNQKLIVSLKSDRRTKYGNYIALLDQVKLAYSESRDEFTRTKYGKKFSELNEQDKNLVKEAIPVIISIAEPETTK